MSRVRRAAMLAALVLGMVLTTASCTGTAPVAARAAAPGSVPVPRPSPTLLQPPQPPVITTSTYIYQPLLDSRDVFPATGEQHAEVLITPAFTMQPGDMRRVIDQLDVSMPGGHDDPEVGNAIHCFDQAGQEIATAGSGTNYTGSGGAYQWNASLLLVAPAQNPAENYDCQIWTYVTSPTTNYHMTVLAPTQGQTTYGTWLKVSSGNQAGAQTWSYGIGTCHPDGTGACQYIGGPARLDNPPAIDVFSGDVWTAADDATTIDADATFQITTCTSGTGSCIPPEHGDSGVRDGEGESYLGIEQLYPDGSVCQVNWAYSEEGGSQVQLSPSYDISDAQHHRPLYYHVSAPVSQWCEGSRQFAFDLHIQWTADNGVKIDGGNVNVINSVTETTTMVPHVIGDTQEQADAAIEAAGLDPVTVATTTVATTPAGTVLSQNSPGGTVEPDNSTVQLTVAIGDNVVTVPSVVGDAVATAEQAISNAGLTYAASDIPDCIDAGTVHSQDPTAGTQVAPGSQVDIQIATCTNGGGAS